ncbi:uncharacterized protein K460DRAFT_370934 [Cucurbitaria berberidis CBS 394.84]|uniref:Uncharacterized protein n=1 Tax=Cucurbitaria berberidis CBS 394.84 TaxID=1168544 RepID=A0A9P4G935_9PLEO|nr:uncharacterized protein K460DRAFT_370934 [Cucurbitaria berberidis CBS 394.84]KAF1840954.1 hypothetical protein K460DRAFT_370934 [Cucurbitaria berberidis CBS 394.84]
MLTKLQNGYGPATEYYQNGQVNSLPVSGGCCHSLIKLLIEIERARHLFAANTEIHCR